MSKAVIPFKIDHLDTLVLRDHEKAILGGGGEAKQRLEALALNGVGGTIIYDGRVLGVIGYYEMWPGLLQVWLLPSIYVGEYAIIFARMTKRWLCAIEKTHAPFRIQTECPDDELHAKWMEFLGFSCETPDGMKNFSVNRLTYKLWSKVF